MPDGWLRKACVTLADRTRGMPLAPRSALAYYYRARLYVYGRDEEKAVADLSEAIRRNGRFAMAFMHRGIAYQVLRLHGLALSDFQTFLALAGSAPARQPEIPYAHFNRGISYKLLGEFGRALEEFDTAIKLNPRFALAYGERGVVYHALHRPAIALRELNASLNLEPNRALGLACRGYVHFYTGAFSRAADDLGRAAALGADTYAMLFWYLARARAGQDAASQLAAQSAGLPMTEWPQPAIAFLLGRTTADRLLGQASSEAEKGEAAFYIGQAHLLREDASGAAAWFRIAESNCPPAYIERTTATVELERLAVPHA